MTFLRHSLGAHKKVLQCWHCLSCSSRHLSAPSLSSCDDASTLHSKLFLFLEGRQKLLEGRTSQQACFWRHPSSMESDLKRKIPRPHDHENVRDQKNCEIRLCCSWFMITTQFFSEAVDWPWSQKSWVIFKMPALAFWHQKSPNESTLKLGRATFTV